MIWNDLARPVKVAVVLGFLAGALGSVFFGFFLVFPLLAVLPVTSVAGSVRLLRVRMCGEQRGILGFIVLLTSTATIILALATLSVTS